MGLTLTDQAPTVSTSEYSYPANTTTAVPTSQTTQGMFQFVVDLGAVAAGDSFRFRLYEKATAAGTQRLVEEWIVSGAQGKPALVTPAFVLGHGWDFTALKIAGSDRSLPGSVRRVI